MFCVFEFHRLEYLYVELPCRVCVILEGECSLFDIVEVDRDRPTGWTTLGVVLHGGSGE